MNKVKPLLDKLGIKPINSWTTIHKYNNNDVCYYYVFKVNGLKYCVSGDSISFVFSNEKLIMPIYAGYNIKELEQSIKKVVLK